jgi:RND family efflux transporter MFP subunit
MSRRRLALGAALLCLIVLIAFFAFRRHQPAEAVSAPRTAAVVTVRRGPLAATLSVAGEFQPYQEVELHAKVSGYIRWIKVDIGDRVHQGEVLATLDVPELSDQLQGAQAEVRHTQSDITRAQSQVVAAKATYAAIHAQYTRLSAAASKQPGLIAQQELDDMQAKDAQAQAEIGVSEATLNAMQQELGVTRANSHRYQTLTNYEQIIAPFNGVVTMRYADTGSLIQAGQSSNTQAMPVVRVAQSDLLRLRMPVPESDVPYIAIGSEVKIRVNANGRTFTGKVIRFTRSLNADTRTMLTEVDVPNPDLSLSPGMYADTTIQLQQKNDALMLPMQAVVQDGTSDFVLVLDSNNRVEHRNVTLGIQTANEMEITSGLQEGDRVIASGQSNYQPGDTVTPHAAFIPTAAQEMN